MLHEACNECTQYSIREYANDNYICSGIVKTPLKNHPYDVIRICVARTDDIKIDDYTPDEVLSIIEGLSTSLNNWMIETEGYKKFRGIKSQQK